MKAIVDLIKTSLVGGLLVLLPVLLFLLLLEQAFQLILAVATPLTVFFPIGFFKDVEFKGIVGLILIVVASLVIGLIARSRTGTKIGSWLERNTVGRFPLYGVVKTLGTTLVRPGEGTAFKPALFLTENIGELAYIIEDQGDGPITILLPWAPTPFAGSVKIVPRDQIRALDVSLADFTRVLSQWGVGAKEVLNTTQKTGSGNPAA